MENSLYAFPYTPQAAIIRPCVLLLHLHTRLHYTPDQRSTIDSSISSDAASFFPFFFPTRFQPGLALLIDPNGLVDFVRLGKRLIVIEDQEL